MRQPQPYFKASHDAWYANIGPNKRPIKLAKGQANETLAWDEYHRQMAGRQPASPDCTVLDLAQRFLDHHKGKSAPATVTFYFRALDSFTRWIGPRLKVADLKPYHVQEWIDRNHRTVKRAEKVDGKYVTKDTGKPTRDGFRRNKACLRWSESQGYIDRSPIRNVKAPPARPRGDEAYLLPEQWNKLIAAVKDQPLLDLLTTMKETGCRPQEVRRVEARHFDRAERCWVFSKDESKGKQDARIVHLTDKVFDICQRLTLKNPVGPLFRNRAGRPWSTQGLDWRCLRLSKKLGLTVTPYSVRHTFATDAIIRGVDLQTIATLMGHVDLKMLSRIYQHIRKRSDHLRAGLKKAVGQ
jgi:integrase